MHESMASLKFVCTNNYKNFTKFNGGLKVTVNSPKVGSKSPILKESPLFAKSNTYVSDLKKNKRDQKSFDSIHRLQSFEKLLSSFLEL